MKTKQSDNKFSRRDFLKLSGVTGAAAAFLANLPKAQKAIAKTMSAGEGSFFEAKPENQLYTVCLQCNTGCGIKVKLLEGLAAKIDGNPYSPWTLWPHPAYETPIKDMAKIEGGICPKGQAGIQTAYDPYRIVSVLKRKPGTKRGEGQWETIPFDQAIQEVVEGGDLFGEGNVDGMKAVRALADAELSKEMKAAVQKIWDEKDAEKKKELVHEFQTEFKDHLDVMIDPEHPDLGPKNNQFMFVWGRMKGGREDVVDRFVKGGYGSINMNGHTTVCQGSLYFTGKAMSAKWNDVKGSFDGGDKFYWQADTANSEFVIYVGTNLFDSNYGPPHRAPKATDAIINGRKFAVVDPRLSKVAARAWKWVPIKPGEDAAMALGMIRWMLENEKYNAAYLAIANVAAQAATGEPNYSNASWLVKLKDGVPGKHLRASELGLLTPQTVQKDGKDVKVYVDAAGVEFPGDTPVALVAGVPTPINVLNAEAAPVIGDLFINQKVGEFSVKDGMQILLESAQEHTIAEWAEIAGISENDILELVSEFTSHGRKAAVDIHRGPSQHTNGFYNNNAWYVVNLLIGNFDYAGGTIKLSTYDRKGSKKGQPFPVLTMWGEEEMSAFGVDIIRTGVAYEKTSLFDGTYPTKRPWFPLASDVYQEDVPSIGDAYPYPVKILMTYMAALPYSLPGGQKVIEILADTKKLPLFIASDIMIGETSMYADYIFPDLSYLERWEFGGSHPSFPWKVENVRNPALSIPGWPTVKVFGEEIAMSFESVFLALAEKLELPGFGPNGFAEGVPYIRPEDHYLKQVADIAFGEKEDGSDSVPEADDEELRIFLEARRFLPPSVFDADKWKAAVGGDERLWRKVVYVLNRGGRYEAFEKGYKGSKVGHPYGRLVNLYQEKTATSINTMTGKPYVGYTKYIPAALSSTGEEIKHNGYDLHLITFKTITMGKARGISNYWTLAVAPEGYLLINASDARKLGIKDDDMVRVSSSSNPEGEYDLQNGRKHPIEGKAKVIEGIRPGVVAFPLGFGHWASGAADVEIDGTVVKGDPRRAAPLMANGAMQLDPVMGNVTLSDLAGGSAVFYDSKVKVEKV
ncbi:MAG: molybdopterin-dependent oxidoreductase [Chloroflexi bacterium]|nr:molybdopterin-dependent oxidoreductase [Chloroflexota bacterium]